jgi:WD40 repeat protein
VSFSPDNTRIASGSSDHTIRIWCADKGTPLLIMEGHTGWVLALAFSPDGKRLVSGSLDTTVRVWDSEIGREELPPLEGHSASVKAVAFSHNGDRILSAATDMTQQIWDANTGQLIPKAVKATAHLVSSAAIAIDDKYLAFGFTDGTVRIWKSAPATAAHVCPRVNDPVSSVTSVAFSPTAEFLFYRYANSQVRVVDLRGFVAADMSLPSIPSDGYDVSPLDDPVGIITLGTRIVCLIHTSLPQSGPFHLDAVSGWVLDSADRRSLWVPIHHRDCVLASSTSGSIILRNKLGKITMVSGVTTNETEWS